MITTATLRPLISGFYDLQKLRIATGNRLYAQFAAKLGIKPGESEHDEDNEEAHKVLELLRLEYERITDGCADRLPSMKRFKGEKLISNYTELCLVDHFLAMEKSERREGHRLGNLIALHPLWRAFLKDIRGCGPIMAAVLLSEIDIDVARYPSSLWQYSGYGVGRDGKGTSRRKEHLVEREYVNKDGEPAKRMSITYNPFLKSKLYILATSFIRSGSQYRDIYDDYKHRLESNPNWQNASKKHRHNAAMRYMIKRFLVDLYFAWKQVEGLPVHAEYSEAKLGLYHLGNPRVKDSV